MQYDAASLRNIKYVAECFEMSLRNDKLEWSHHAEVASLKLIAVTFEFTRRLVNLTRDQWEYFLGVRYNRAKKAPYGRSDRNFSGDQNDTPKTADLLAVEYGVSPATVKTAGKTAQLLDEHPNELPRSLHIRRFCKKWRICRTGMWLGS